MESIKTIGTILTEPAERDAIHVAILPAEAEMRLRPGQEVRMIDKLRAIGKTEWDEEKGHVFHPHGIVDPFLKTDVEAGQRFWVFLFPNSISSLRHSWRHPKIDADSRESEIWLREFALRWKFDYEDMIRAALDPEGGFILAQGKDLHGANELGDDHDLFWHHLGVCFYSEFDEEHRKKIEWTCSC